MRCKDVVEQLDEYRTRELDSRKIDAIRHHLDVCSDCEEVGEEIEELAVAATDLVMPAPSCVSSVLDCVSDGLDVVETPSGFKVWVAWTDRGITETALARRDATSFASHYCRRTGRGLVRRELPDKLRSVVLRALSGEGDRKAALDLIAVSGFQRRVLEALLEIPKGEVRTYAWVAREVGSPAATRAVGTACRNNPIPFVIPCHRVVPASGGLGRYAYGETLKRDLLAREGVPVDTIDELALKHVRYVGSATTHIYCFPTCSGAKQIKPENQVLLRDESEASAKGFRPCLRCRPLAA